MPRPLPLPEPLEGKYPTLLKAKVKCRNYMKPNFFIL